MCLTVLVIRAMQCAARFGVLNKPVKRFTDARTHPFPSHEGFLPRRESRRKIPSCAWAELNRPEKRKAADGDAGLSPEMLPC